ncbi:MAG TPA: peptidase, partial [Cyanophyceae cyanobacterium]
MSFEFKARTLGRRQRHKGRRLILLVVAIAIGLLVTSTRIGLGQNSSSLPSSLPTPQIHPLPSPLAQWQDTSNQGDYFSEIKPTPVGYLVWSQFPVKVYVERPSNPTESSSSVQRFQAWGNAVLQAIQEWSVYLPLEVIEQPTQADISILRSRPPLQASVNRETGQLNLPRARAAETRYKFYLRQIQDVPE